jgi:hypothetical protein
VATHVREMRSSRKIVSAMLLLLTAALVANCGGDSSDSSPSPGGGAGPGSAGDAGQPGVAGTSGGKASTAGTGAGPSQAGSAPTAGSNDEGGGGGTSNTGAAGEVGRAGENAGGSGENSGGSGDAAGAGGTAPVSICPESVVDFPKLYAQAICKKRVACCADDDQETCMTQVSEALAKNIYPDLAKAAQDGSVEANCPALEQCIAAIEAADCSEWPLEMPVLYGVPAGEPVCRDIIKGKLAANAACTSNYQCDFGACVGEEALVCYPLAKDGEKCDNETNLCNLATSYCGPAKQCVPRLPNGAACENIDQCLSRRCDTVDSHKCLAPAPKDCKFVPKACSMASGHVPGSVAWPLIVVGLALTAGARRRRRI